MEVFLPSGVIQTLALIVIFHFAFLMSERVTPCFDKQTLDMSASVEARYTALLSQLHLVFEVGGVMMIVYRMLLWRAGNLQVRGEGADSTAATCGSGAERGVTS